MPIVGAVLLLTVHRNLGAVHVQHDGPWRFDGFRPGDQLAVDRGQPVEILFLGKQVGLEGLRPGCQRRPAAPPRPVTSTSARSADLWGTAETTRTN